jgi:polyisoprenoid-binding protein YceI
MGVLKFTNKAHQMTISGTSNLHDWSTNVEQIQLQAEMELVKGFVSSVGTVSLSAKVESIKSDKGSVMDNKTKEALKGDKYPIINYRLKQVAISEQKNNISLLKTEGSLSIAGVTKQVKMDVYARQLPNGDVEVWGGNDIKMSDYGMKAPTALMGTIKTGDAVKVTFSVILKK